MTFTLINGGAAVYMGRAKVFDHSAIIPDADMHAVQWDEDSGAGHVQYKSKPQEILTSIAAYQPAIDEVIRLCEIEDAPPVLTLESARDEQIDVITRAANEELGAITDQYPETEQKTWPNQKDEATGYLADNQFATPTLDGILMTRAGTKESLSNRILELAAQYSYSSGVTIGKRQGLCDQIHAAQTIADVRTIVWY